MKYYVKAIVVVVVTSETRKAIAETADAVVGLVVEMPRRAIGIEELDKFTVELRSAAIMARFKI